MHRTPRTTLVVAAVATVLLGAGCTTLVPGLPAPSGAAPAAGTAVPTETDPVAWMDRICTAMLPALETRSAQPQLDPANPRDSVAALSSYLGDASTAVDGAITGMAAAGPSPIEGGDEAVAALTTTLTAFRDSTREAKTRIDAIDTSNPRSLATELPQAVEPLTALSNLPNPASELGRNPELDQAAAQAPQCQQVSQEIN
jgi:hypothetical protein